MVLLDLLGRRMALRILWELSIAKGPLTFRGLQAAAQTNPSVLNKRLKELRDGRLVAHNGQGYQLTAVGTQLLTLFLPLHVWADQWASQLKSDQPNHRGRLKGCNVCNVQLKVLLTVNTSCR
jgi:DNA-binding HxlR family transcriptional regulator